MQLELSGASFMHSFEYGYSFALTPLLLTMQKIFVDST